MRILVVDDDRPFADSLVEALEDLGYAEPRACYSAIEALNHVAEHPVDLVISDVRMAGMDGLGLLAELQRTRPEIRSIVITGYADADAPGRAVAARTEDYLYKPFSVEQLHASIKSLRPLVPAHEGPADLLPMVELRQSVLRAFYVGLRSGGLTDGYPLWVALEDLDRQIASYLSAPSAPASQALERRQLVEGLLALRRWIQLMVAAPSTRSSSTWFEALTGEVRQGRLGPEELSLAPLLRTAPQAPPQWRALQERLQAL